MESNNTPEGMATKEQLEKIAQLTAPPGFRLPLASFLKSITGGKAASPDELTSAQARDVIGSFKKLKK